MQKELAVATLQKANRVEEFTDLVKDKTLNKDFTAQV